MQKKDNERRPAFIWLGINRMLSKSMRVARASKFVISCARRSVTSKIAKELEPFKYDELPIDIPPADPVSNEINGMVEEILNLNVIEYGQFLKRIQLRSGIADETMLSRMGNSMLVNDPNKSDDELAGSDDDGQDDSPAQAQAPVAAVEVKVKEFFDVKLGAVDPKSKIKIIKEIRTITALGLKEAKELVEKAPVVIKTGVKKEEAEKIMKLIVDCGGIVELL
jgi:large subunit ribosomal protein L7/L12